MKSLIVGVVGDNSLHKNWINNKDSNIDLFLVYYGNNNLKKQKYKKESEYYSEKKGTKFNIVYEIYNENKEIFEKYDYIFIPDDDVFLNTNDIKKMLKIAKEYKLKLFQPALIGYYSVPITLAVSCNLLRYTNFVEIMCPCFEIETFKKLHNTFNYNKSCWGIDILWDINLDKPHNEIAIIDDVIAIHTRPVYQGDNYLNNQIKKVPHEDIIKICKKYNLEIPHNKKTYKSIVKKSNWEKEYTIFPNTEKMEEICKRIRKTLEIY